MSSFPPSRLAENGYLHQSLEDLHVLIVLQQQAQCWQLKVAGGDTSTDLQPQQVSGGMAAMCNAWHGGCLATLGYLGVPLQFKGCL
jgi:hypothetical protein